MSLRSATSVQIPRRSVTLLPLFCNQLRISFNETSVLVVWSREHGLCPVSIYKRTDQGPKKGGHLCHVLSIIKIGDVVVRSDAGRGKTCLISLYGARTFIVSSPLDAIITHTFVFHYILRFYLWADCGEIDVTLWNDSALYWN